MSELEKNYTNELANLERLLEEKENQLSKLKAQDANRSDYEEVSPSKNFKEKKKVLPSNILIIVDTTNHF